VIRRVFEQDAFADRAFYAEAAGLDARDRALAMALAYGVVQRRATLDWVAGRLSDRSLDRLDPPVLAALRLGLLQLLFMGGIADHAAVNDSVELAKASGRGGATLVNAVLRRATREGPDLLASLDDSTPSGAAVLHSVPEWVAALWWDELGAARTRSLLRAVNAPAESAIRVNTLRAGVADVLAQLPAGARSGPWPPGAVIVPGAFDAFASELFRAGAIMPQSRASQLVAHVLAPRPGERVLDLCAAPGGKTTHLAALMEGRGELVAVERNPQRADGLVRTCRRMGAGFVDVVVGDAAVYGGGGRARVAGGVAVAGRAAAFDRVLVDPPCSGLGTLQSRPDLRWRASPARLSDASALQARILRAGAAALATGGTLVYSVCTISRAEGVAVVDRFIAEAPEFVLEDLGATWPELTDAANPRYLQVLPDRDETDGFFVARLRRG
jgi:16S rRNA (cytosine967-C5)-methyltransferase